MLVRTPCLALLSTVIALSGAAGASAATRSHSPVKSPPHPKVTSTASANRAKGHGVVKPVRTSGPTVAAISAFPTGGKGSGTEATCALWSDRLQEDQDAQDNATEKQDVIDATENLHADVNDALDAGCVVIY